MRGITHLGLNFWRKLVESPSYCFGSNNAFLLCLDDDGLLLLHFSLTNRISYSSIVMQSCISLARASGASRLVRIQTRPADPTDPFQINSSATKALYDAAELYDLPLTEVVVSAR
jgi:hypothetical protein